MTNAHALPSFASRSETGISYWLPSETGNWLADNAQGRQYAAELVDLMATYNSPMMLGHVVKAIAERGKHGGVEVGFFHGIAMAAMIES